MLSSTLLMVRPAAFGFNPETAGDNSFQSKPSKCTADEIREKALQEFEAMVGILEKNEIRTLVVNDTAQPGKPSAVFPNSWLSTSPEGGLFVYPLAARNRRPEKRDDVLDLLRNQYLVNDFQDWSEYEAEGRFLEGTGSMVIDHENKIIYACLSPRTSFPLLEKFAARNHYQALTFLARDIRSRYIYHTNIMMNLGDDFAVLCNESIEEEWERIAVRQLLESTGHEIINISFEQMHAFAGNMLAVKNEEGKTCLLMSEAAHQSLEQYQLEELARYAKLIAIPVPTIETTEGGSVRSMLAEIFLTGRNPTK